MLSKWVVNGFAVAIIAVWVVSCMVSLFNPTYAPPVSVQWTISVLAGAAFGKAAVDATKITK